ncbi:cupin [Streptomyces sp. LP05-1]|uniref:Acireductone dioxygenase n=1 Tax=Streptomyces pyxinae TaxID=2970734 RepID=A0ABT2C9N9_9ACTN|nr:cupin [Streptomyces sp. LP05-1]MCS0634117.1 cupin [Streptomyces sp. LP05-1]
MTLLQIMPAAGPGTVYLRTEDLGAIRGELLKIGVRFARWHAARRIPADADDATIMNAYRSHIGQVSAESGYRVVDVARLTHTSADPEPSGPGRPNRDKFREEHIHDEDLTRFVVAGAGCLYLHAAGLVYAVLCTGGDLLSVPSRTAHWFDAGARPRYTAVRFFREDGRRTTRFLPDGIAARFPTLDDLLAPP